MTLLITIVAFAIALGTLITVHELGHYLVARLCNVKVLKFSVGFGRALVSRRYGRDQTEWAVTAFPLGGYVKMLDEREGEVQAHELDRAFNRQPVMRRFAIVLAGPMANFLLAIVLYWVIFLNGMPGVRPVVGNVAPGSAVATAGFTPGEIISSIGGERVVTWQDARWKLLEHAVSHRPVQVEVRSLSGGTAVRTLDTSGLSADQLDADFMTAFGFLRSTSPIPSFIGPLMPGGAAQRAGLLEGDQVVAIEGRAIRSWDEMVKVIRASPGAPLSFDIMRQHTLIKDLRVVPDAHDDKGVRIGRVGIGDPYFVQVRYGAVESLKFALLRTWETSVFSLRMLGKLVIGEVSLKNLSGPITIADYAGQSAQAGWIPYIIFVALISISLGVLNLLPIPLLDGGHLMYYMFEIIKGSPVSDRVQEFGQRIGMGVLLLLMACALFNDITRLVNG